MQQSPCSNGRSAIPDPLFRQSIRNWFLTLADTDPEDVGAILEGVAIVCLILCTRLPQGPAPALTTTRDRSRLWRRALRDFFVFEDEKAARHG